MHTCSKKVFVDCLEAHLASKLIRSISSSIEEKYLQSLVFYLKKESPRQVEHFLRAVLPLMRHAKFPLIGLDAWILLYKRFLFYPQIISELVFLAKKLRGVKPDEQFWKFVFTKSGLNRDSKAVQTVRLTILAYCINNRLIPRDPSGNTSSLCQVVFDLNIPQSWTNQRTTIHLFEGHKAFQLMRFHLEAMTQRQVPGLEVKKAISLHFTSWIGHLNYSAEYKACLQVLYSGLPANFLLDLTWSEVNKLVFLYTNNTAIFDALKLRDCTDLRFKHVVGCLFEHYCIGDLFLKAFLEDRLTQQESAWFQFILKGGNLSQAPHLPVRLTKKGAHIVRCHKGDFTSVKQGVFFAALHAEIGDEVFVRRCLVGNIQLTDLDYWVATLSCLYKKGLRSREVIEVMDYLRIHALNSNERIDLKHMKLNNLFRKINAWHDELRNRRRLVIRNQALPVLGIKEERIQLDQQQFIIRQIKSATELFEEGKQLHHCVYTYLYKCLSGRSYIFSLCEVENLTELTKPLITIELSEDKIVQAKGKHNRYPTDFEMELIRKWAEENNLNLAA